MEVKCKKQQILILHKREKQSKGEVEQEFTIKFVIAVRRESCLEQVQQRVRGVLRGGAGRITCEKGCVTAQGYAECHAVSK